MSWRTAFDELELTIASRHHLLAMGATPRMLTAAVRAAHLIRVRRDHYALPGTDRHILRAVRVGGRLSCDSALRDLGVFGFDNRRTHIHLHRDASRLRKPDVRRPIVQPLESAELHWHSFVDPAVGTEYRLALVDALASVFLCGHPHHAIASLDNALHLGFLDEADIPEVFQRLPQRLHDLRLRVDARSEAGQETVLRLAFQDAGLEPEIQVVIDGVGRVDTLLEGRLICEADSRLAHDGWALHVRDRERDVAAAQRGYMSLRPAYDLTMHRTQHIVDAVLHLLAATRRFRTWL